MIGRLLFAAAGVAAAAALAAPGGAAPARKSAPSPAKGVDWSKRVAATPEGGFVMGNPAAPVKVVEYGSLTCGHCAAFSEAAFGTRAGAPLAARVRTGKVSYEFRNFILNGIDVAATLIARCAGPAGFFKLTESAFATQPHWVGRISGLSEPQKAQWKALPEGQMLVRLAEAGGLIQLAGRAGVPAARARACVADPAGLERLGKIYEAADALGVTGTPTFFINGRNIGIQSWATLEPMIRQSGG